mgnify:CR=1 FL=1
MIRFFADIIYLFFFLTLTAPLYPLFDHWNKTGKAHKRSSIAQRMILRSFKICLAMAGTKLIVDGQENIPEDGAVLYVGNHSSYYDILCSYVATERGMGFFAKKEMEKVPLLSTWMKRLHCLFLDRNDLKQGLKTILTAIEKVKSGISICIFPEGTRNNGEELSMLPFRDGALKIAEKTGCAIIPISMNNTADIFEAHFPRVKKVHVVIEYGKPIYPKELDKETRKHLGIYCHDLIQDTIKKNASLI